MHGIPQHLKILWGCDSPYKTQLPGVCEILPLVQIDLEVVQRTCIEAELFLQVAKAFLAHLQSI